ncbi:MAG: DmsE family decaheme c-type cytochrome [Acidobacteriota bacterium]
MGPLLLLILLGLPPAAPAAQPLIGSDVCRKCHPDVWLKFYKNPHYKTIALANQPPERTGCESCHGPGRAHVEGSGNKAAIRAFSVLEPARILDACLACHAGDLGKAHIRRSQHTEAGVVCTNCHSIHKPATDKFLLARTQREVCYGCHAPVRTEFSMPFKHRVNEGFMQCTDCHNPHGSAAPSWRMAVRPRMVEQALAGEEACLKCHSDKRGPFVFEHTAVRIEGCETCHRPHGGPNPRLLRRPVVFTLCLECHTGAGNFGRRGTGERMQSPAHNMADPRYHTCTLCHVRIHGSNADPLFLR